MHRHDVRAASVIVLEPRNAVTTLTFDASRHNSMPIWSPPKGERIAYSSLQKGKWGLYQTLSNGPASRSCYSNRMSRRYRSRGLPTSNYILFWAEDPKTAGDLWVYQFDQKKATALVDSTFNETPRADLARRKVACLHL